MNENLRSMLDAMNDLTEQVHKEAWKLDQTCFAIAEETEDDPASELIPGMLQDATEHVKNARGSLLAIADYITDVAKELL